MAQNAHRGKSSSPAFFESTDQSDRFWTAIWDMAVRCECSSRFLAFQLPLKFKKRQRPPLSWMAPWSNNAELWHGFRLLPEGSQISQLDTSQTSESRASVGFAARCIYCLTVLCQLKTYMFFVPNAWTTSNIFKPFHIMIRSRGSCLEPDSTPKKIGRRSSSKAWQLFHRGFQCPVRSILSHSVPCPSFCSRASLVQVPFAA